MYSLKRTIVWIDNADKDSAAVRKLLNEYLDKAGLRYSIFEVLEVMESETGFINK